MIVHNFKDQAKNLAFEFSKKICRQIFVWSLKTIKTIRETRPLDFQRKSADWVPYSLNQLKVIFKIFSDLCDQMRAIHSVDVVVVARIHKVIHLLLVVDGALHET